MTIDVVDLFCGAGGMSLGFKSVGYRVVTAIDNWQPAVETYLANLGAHVTLAEIGDDTLLPATDVIVGGPPCQGFSSLRRTRLKRGQRDTKKSLLDVFGERIAQILPKAVILENVKGFRRNLLTLIGANTSSDEIRI